MSESVKTLVLGVTGGIAAYKSADLCSKLVQQGWCVQVVMTENATKLVAPIVFATLSRNPVITSLWDLPQWQPGHVALAERADLLVVAPATANFLGKYANGIADDALTTVSITHRKPVLLAPAMNPQMWRSPAVEHNLEVLRARGVRTVGPEAGHVACGADGIGRMASVEEILTAIQQMTQR